MDLRLLVNGGDEVSDAVRVTAGIDAGCAAGLTSCFSSSRIPAMTKDVTSATIDSLADEDFLDLAFCVWAVALRRLTFTV